MKENMRDSTDWAELTNKLKNSIRWLVFQAFYGKNWKTKKQEKHLKIFNREKTDLFNIHGGSDASR